MPEIPEITSIDVDHDAQRHILLGVSLPRCVVIVNPGEMTITTVVLGEVTVFSSLGCQPEAPKRAAVYRPAAARQNVNVTWMRARRGAAIAVGVSHAAPLVRYSYVC
jgi:hypothetical protein